MQNNVNKLLDQLERDPLINDRKIIIDRLRSLELDEFGEIMFKMPDKSYPKLSQLLPSMASEEVQRNWTGNSGIHLLKQTLDFIQSVKNNYTNITGRSLQQASMLDYGCGYGRIARLFYYFTDEDNLTGVDPWDISIELCHQNGLINNFYISEYLPTTLPVEYKKYDLIYAFSVFTHLSEKAADMAVNTIKKYLAPNGLLVITIRPVEYWSNDPNIDQENKIKMIAMHQSKEFAFKPHEREKIDGEITYGDTSMSLEWLKNRYNDMEIINTDSSSYDPLQIYVYMIPKKNY